jgi:hypothetical protein
MGTIVVPFSVLLGDFDQFRRAGCVLALSIILIKASALEIPTTTIHPAQ